MKSIINHKKSYTFSKYFDLKIDPKDLAQSFGYNFSRKRLYLPQFAGELEGITELKDRIEEILPLVSLDEKARREIMISPVILNLIHYTKSELRIEYFIKVNEQLQGYLDYFLEKQKKILVVEAKKGDLDYGFTQLVAELITLDKWEEKKEQIYMIGAISTGQIWQFCRIDRQKKHIEQGLQMYRVPDDLEILMRIMVQCLIV